MFKTLFVLSDDPFGKDTGTNNKIRHIMKVFAQHSQCAMIYIADTESKSTFDIRLLYRAPIPQFSLKNKIWAILKLIFSRQPIFIHRYFNLDLIDYIQTHQQALNQYDIVFFDTIRTAEYRKFFSNDVCILSPHDSPSLIMHYRTKHTNWYKKLFYTLYTDVVREYENKVYPTFQYVHFVVADDQTFLRDNGYKYDNLISIPLSIDESFFYSTPKKQNNTLLFWGSLDIDQIRDGLFFFLNDVWPFMPEKIKSTLTIKIIGGKNTSQYLKPAKEIVPLNWVEDIHTELEEARIIIFPETGTGMKTRVMQALAKGKCVIGSPDAFKGLKITNGIQGCIAETAQEYRAIITKIMTDTKLALSLEENSKQYITDHFSNQAVGHQWEIIIKKCKDLKNIR